LFDALDEADLDPRIVEGLPWLALAYIDMDWEWLAQNAKLHRRQNRLGFVVALAIDLARPGGQGDAGERSQPFVQFERLRACSALAAVLASAGVSFDGSQSPMPSVQLERLRRRAARTTAPASFDVSVAKSHGSHPSMQSERLP
jgi:hypothetical protein